MTDKDNFKNMVEIMDILRSENGCPWDREQTHQTLKPHLIEESYEVLEAIEDGSMEMLKEELGDLLLQVLFHSQIAKENGSFSINDVITSLKEKIIRRHPHVFDKTSVKDSKEVMFNWEKIKRQEKKDRKSVLDGVPRILPSLIRARQVQAKAARVGFDFPDKEEAFLKVEEEVREFKEAVFSKNQDEIEEEFGDFLFSLVNVSRFVSVDPEESMRKAIDKFIRRFKSLEEAIESSGGSFDKLSLEEMDAMWSKNKESEGKK